MNDNLRSRIERLRRSLAARPDGITFGEFRSGMQHQPRLELHRLHADFLSVADGGRFGIIDLWSSAELPVNQFRVTGVVSDKERQEIGQIAYQPIFLDHSDGVVELPRFHGAPRLVNNFDVFLEEFVFGRRYAELFEGVADDKWNDFLLSTTD